MTVADLTLADLWRLEDDYEDSVFLKRGIKPEVAEARPYRRWTAPIDRQSNGYADFSAAYEEFDYDSLQKHQKSHLTSVLKQSDGWVIVRRAPSGVRVATRTLRGHETTAPYPELRPDQLVQTCGPSLLWHGWDDSVLNGLKRRPTRLKAEKALREHIDKEFVPNPDPTRFPDKDPVTGLRYFYGGHGGVNINEPHYHLALPKYVFLNRPYVEKWWDDDKKYKGKPQVWLDSHRKRHHGGEAISGRHPHIVKAKRGPAVRLDVHEWAEPLFAEAEVVFFGIEGCMKADAMLSAGEAVFSVPAVGQWRAPELQEFARRYLKDKLVVIVPDADWYEKPDVIREARECQEYLDGLGVDAYIAAPPRSRLPEIKGVDDFLGPDSEGKLEDLEVITYEPDQLMIDYVYSWPSVRLDARRNSVRILKTLVVATGQEGRGQFRGKLSRRALGRRLGVGDITVRKAIERLEEHGALKVDGDNFEITEPYRVRETPPERLGDVLTKVNRNLTNATL